MMQIKLFLASFGVALVFAAPLISHAQAELVPDVMNFAKAKVLEVTDEKEEIIEGTGTSAKSQTLKVEVLDGEEKGKVVSFKNDYIQLRSGEVFFFAILRTR